VFQFIIKLQSISQIKKTPKFNLISR